MFSSLFGNTDNDGNKANKHTNKCTHTYKPCRYMHDTFYAYQTICYLRLKIPLL